MKIRRIKPSDNSVLATIIRSSLTEYKKDLTGTVYYDDSTDHLYELFQKDKSAYYVAEKDGEILGGCGLYPTEGLDTDTVELVKMYLKKESRGKQIGYQLLDHCIKVAKELAYQKVYLESMPELKSAIRLYENYGFKHLNCAMGNSGHHGCNIWMLYEQK